MEALRRLKKSDMQTAEEIMNKHFKECFEIHNEKVSEKYILYFHKAMKCRLIYDKVQLEH